MSAKRHFGLPLCFLLLAFGVALRAAPHRVVQTLPAADQGVPGTFPAEALKEDLRALWAMLDEGHAALDRFTSRDALKRMFDEAGEGITSPLTEVEFFRRVLPLVAAIGDGHTRLDPSPAADAFLRAQPVHLPLVLRFVGGKVYIFRNLSPDQAIREGTELLAVNGVGSGDLLSRLMALVPSDAGITTRKLRLLEDPWIFGRLLALELNRPATYRLSLRNGPDGPSQDITVPGVKADEIAAALREGRPGAGAGTPPYVLSFRGKIPLLTIRAFTDDTGPGRPAYADFLRNAFAEIAKSGASGLVIDLRTCGGGQDDYAKLLFAHVADQPFLYYQSMETKKDRYDFFRYTNESAAGAEELARQVRKNDRGRFDVLGHPNSGPQSPERPGFSGRVAVLIGGGSASATGEAVLLFHYHRKATFFGEECGAAYGSSTGYMVTATLPRSGLRVRIPLVLTTMAVGGYARDHGLLPEVPVGPTIEDLRAGRDPVLDRALEFLTNDEAAEDLTPVQARALIESGDRDRRIVILDVRTPAEFADGHLKAALNVDFRDEGFARRLETLDKTAPYLVYCRGGRRSFAAMGLMKSLGFLRVFNLEGGFLGWQKEAPDLVEK